MIIGFEAKRIFQNCSGLGNYGRNTVNMLARFYPENKYKLFAPKFTDLYALPDSAEVITPSSFLSQFFTSYWRFHVVTELLTKNNIDIFHGLSHALPFGIEKTGIPSVVTIHDLIFMRFPEYYKRIDRNMYQSIYRSSCNRATKIIAISKQTRADLIKYFGVEASKIEVIYQSCDRRFYDRVTESQKTSVRLKFNLPEKFILCVGTIEKRKNQLAIIEAVVKEKFETTIVILGKPTEYIDQLNQFISEQGIQKQVIFLHNTDFGELQAIYQMAELMIYPSFFEGFGLPVIEAQASGCPVITSNISSLPEAGGDGALYINPSDISEIGRSIYKILSNTQLKTKLIQDGTANAELFSEKYVSQRLMKLYCELMAKA
jgi:glycosyltransferase involved in cell wall biosynthesis